MQICYLVEPTSVTQTGAISGKTLRTYEVELTIDNSRPQYPRNIVKSTGKVFTVDNGKLVVKKTKASLNSKHVSSYQNSIYSSLDMSALREWGSILCTTPELALAVKNTAIKQATQKQLDTLQTAVKSLTDFQATIADTHFIHDEYPELFI
jgi:hypothetical protein